MITTVTTITTTTVTAVAVLGFTAAISIAAVITLMLLLATRELANAGHSRFSLRIARLVGVGILPLLMAFAAIVVVKITELL